MSGIVRNEAWDTAPEKSGYEPSEDKMSFGPLAIAIKW